MNKILSALLLPLVLLLPPASKAAQELSLKDGDTATITMSLRDITRIAMTGGRRLAKVWGPEDALERKADEDRGEVYLSPKSAMPGEAISFFVRDDAGATYTLVAKIDDVPSQTVLIRGTGSAPPKNVSTGTDPGVSEAYRKRIKALVRAMALGKVPDRYSVEPVNQTVPLWKETRIVFTERLVGTLIGEHWVVTNITPTELLLDEAEFRSIYPDIAGVSIMQKVLRAGDRTDLFIVRRSPT